MDRCIECKDGTFAKMLSVLEIEFAEPMKADFIEKRYPMLEQIFLFKENCLEILVKIKVRELKSQFSKTVLGNFTSPNL